MPEPAHYQCAACGEWIETTVDESGGGHQRYVEDCQVCCRPMVLDIRWNPDAAEYDVYAEPES